MGRPIRGKSANGRGGQASEQTIDGWADPLEVSQLMGGGTLIVGRWADPRGKSTNRRTEAGQLGYINLGEQIQ